MRATVVAGLAGLALAAQVGCTPAPAFEDPQQANALRITSVTVTPPPPDRFYWNDREPLSANPFNGQCNEDFMPSQSRVTDKATACTPLVLPPDAKAGLRAELAALLEADLERMAAAQFGGSRDAELTVTLEEMRTSAAIDTLMAGSGHYLTGTIALTDAATGERLAGTEEPVTAVTGPGVGGIVGAAIEASDDTDPVPVLSRNFATGTCEWLRGTPGSCS